MPFQLKSQEGYFKELEKKYYLEEQMSKGSKEHFQKKNERVSTWFKNIL